MALAFIRKDHSNLLLLITTFAYCYGLNFSKTMALLLSVLYDFSVRCREITLVINRIQSANSDNQNTIYHLVKRRKYEDPCLREEYIAATMLLLDWEPNENKRKALRKTKQFQDCYLKDVEYNITVLQLENKTIVQSLSSLLFCLHLSRY